MRLFAPGSGENPLSGRQCYAAQAGVGSDVLYGLFPYPATSSDCHHLFDAWDHCLGASRSHVGSTVAWHRRCGGSHRIGVGIDLIAFVHAKSLFQFAI